MDKDNRNKPPSEKADLEAKIQKEKENRANRRLSLLRSDFTRTFQTAHGKRVLQWLRQRCGHNKVILSATRAETVDPMMTTFAAMELNLYLTVREYLPTEILKEIENDGTIEPAGTIIEPTSGATIERTARKRKRDTAAE